jgi:hypothetical protein
MTNMVILERDPVETQTMSFDGRSNIVIKNLVRIKMTGDQWDYVIFDETSDGKNSAVVLMRTRLWGLIKRQALVMILVEHTPLKVTFTARGGTRDVYITNKPKGMYLSIGKRARQFWIRVTPLDDREISESDFMTSNDPLKVWED